MDCTTCANRKKLTALHANLRWSVSNLSKDTWNHCEADSENPWQIRATPCPFLKDNLCSVYEDRPADCSGFPYLYRPDFMSRTSPLKQFSLGATAGLVFREI